VTFYIPESAVDSTLRFVAGHSAPGSRIVFDYFLETALKSPGIIALNKRLSAMGEPFIFGIPDQNREAFVSRRGLVMESDLGMTELRRRYLPSRFVDPSQPSLNFICTAVVPARVR
jgi:O-methyltransferase involved in polyketide biosynthesis